MSVIWNKEYDSFATATMDKKARAWVQESVFTNNKLFKYMKGEDTKEGKRNPESRYLGYDGANEIHENVQLVKNATAGHHAPMAALDNTKQDEFIPARYFQANFSVQYVMSGFEIANCTSPVQIFNLAKERARSAGLSLSDVMGDALFGTGDGTAYDLIGLKTMVADDPTTTSVGEIPTTETDWRNYYNASAVAFSTGGESALQIASVNCTKSGLGSPDLIVTDIAGWNRYANALRAKGQAVLPFSTNSNSGFDSDALRFGSARVIWDEKCPANHWYLLNTKALKLRYLNGADFAAEGPILDKAVDAKFYRIKWIGQLTTNARRCLGVLTNVGD